MLQYLAVGTRFCNTSVEKQNKTDDLDMILILVKEPRGRQCSMAWYLPKKCIATESHCIFLFSYFYGIAQIYMDSEGCQSSDMTYRFRKEYVGNQNHTQLIYFKKPSHKSPITFPLKFTGQNLVLLLSIRILCHQLKFGILLAQNKRKMGNREYQAL